MKQRKTKVLKTEEKFISNGNEINECFNPSVRHENSTLNPSHGRCIKYKQNWI